MAMDLGGVAFGGDESNLLTGGSDTMTGPVGPIAKANGGTGAPAQNGNASGYGNISDYGALLASSFTPAPVDAPAATFADAPPPPGIDIDLSTYVMIGRYDLPEPTRTVAPVGNLLGQESSGVTYNWDSNTLFIIGDGGTAITEVSLTGELVSTMTLAAGSSPQGTTFYDTETITYIGNGQFVFAEERWRQAVKFTYVAGGTLTRDAAQTVDLGTDIGNVGLEGLTWDPLTGGFIFVKEKDPLGIFQTMIDFDNGTASNGSSTTVNSTNLFDPTLLGLSDLSDVYAFSSNSAFVGTSQEGTLLILSQEAGKVVEIDRAGNILSTLVLTAPFTQSGLSLQAMTVEGITMDAQGRIYIVSEEGGGDFDHPQLWVFDSATGQNEAPTALDLSNALTAILENTNTASRVKVADLVLTDDGLGNNQYSVTGADAQYFEVDSSGLYIKAGVTLDYETKTSYSVTVEVDDTSVGNTPDASVAYTLAVTNVVNESAAGTVVVSEVAPWASGNSTLGADWFEITNTGSTAIDISGWKVDDNSNLFSAAVALSGVTSIAAGESVIFIEKGSAVDAATLINSFKSLWFGSNVPAAIQIGTYTGSGIGLGTSGDAVNIYNSSGVLQANVSFGSSPASAPYATFDNGLGASGAISTLSATGTRGAFVAANASTEIGSPGTVGGVPAPVNKAPTAIGLTSEITSIAENSSTTSRVKVAGIVVTDDGLGTNTLAVTGADAQYFEVDSSGLYIKAGVTLDYETKASYSVNVTVDDSSVGGTPDASVAFTMTVTDVNEPTIRITEVAPWSSGNSPVGADWFEVTNFGDTAVDLTGWKMDDSSASFANAVSLTGITSIAAGESVIFLESSSASIVSTFISNWFGGYAPAGLQIGTYSGAGIGLSTGGDGVVLFDSAGAVQAAVAFGASPSSAPYGTFDNSAGLNGVTLSTISSAGTNGAFTAENSPAEIGSPGEIGRFTLQLLHFSDAEAGALAPSTAHLLAAMVDAFEDDYANSITLASGDLFLPGPFLAAGTDLSIKGVLNQVSGSTISLAPGVNIPIGAVDVQIMNQIGVQLSAIGNHEFDLGSRVLRDAISPNLGAAGYVGANYAYLSANLDFSGDADLNPRFTNTVGTGTLANEEASDLKGRIAPSAVIYEGGEPIGFVGATTQMLEQISSPSGTEVKGFPTGPGANGETNDMALLAAQLQVAIDDLIAQGVNKIVLVSHLQDYHYELALAPLLHGVDIIIAGGSHARFGDADDTAVAFPGHSADFDQTYPIVTTNADGKTTLIVNTDGEYTYLGRLVVDFDANGDIIMDSVTNNVPINGAYASTVENVADAWNDHDGDLSDTAFADGTRGEQVQDLTEAVNAVIVAKDGNVYGYTDVYLEGERSAVRTQETNLGNLSADANAAAARKALGLADDVAIVSIKNGGGIRAQIGTIVNGDDGVSVVKLPPETGGEVSQLDVENALRFDNKLMVFDTTAQGLLNILNSPNALAPNNGGFIQIGGVQFSYDPTAVAGSRVRDVALVDADGNKVAIIAEDGVVNPYAPALIQGIVLNFTANGGDGYLFKANASNFRYVQVDGTLSAAVDEALDFTATATIDAYAGSSANLLGEQKAFADYMQDRYGTPETAFDEADTGQALDTRIQNQSARADTVLVGDFILKGAAGADVLIGRDGNDMLTGLAGNDALRGGSGNDRLTGDDGNDRLTGGTGNDIIDGGAGNDLIFMRGASGIDAIDGGAGTDRLLAESDNTRFAFSSITGVENISANGHADVAIYGTSAADNFDFSATSLVGITAINAGSGDDIIVGSAGADVILGGGGLDTLSGGAGNDIIEGGLSADTMNGGSGDDVFRIGLANGFDAIDGGADFDSILATADNVRIGLTAISNVELISADGYANVTISGYTTDDVLDFSGMTLTGIASISGHSGDDRIVGSAAADVIIGGNGADLLTGGAGNDRFVYNSYFESRTGIRADHITDFATGDLIDLRNVDADLNTDGVQAFSFVGSAAFTDVGQLRVATVGGQTALLGNVAGSLGSDFMIILDNNHALVSADLLLV